MNILGIDIGTTGSKAVIFNENFQVASEAYQSYPLYMPDREKKELNPREVQLAVFRCIKQCCQNGKGKDSPPPAK